jgi:hypothetical protein
MIEVIMIHAEYTSNQNDEVEKDREDIDGCYDATPYRRVRTLAFVIELGFILPH